MDTGYKNSGIDTQRSSQHILIRLLIVSVGVFGGVVLGLILLKQVIQLTLF